MGKYFDSRPFLKEEEYVSKNERSGVFTSVPCLNADQTISAQDQGGLFVVAHHY